MAKKGSPDDANPGGKRSAAPFVPKTTSIKALSAASHDCRGCDLYKTATQVVFGAGPSKARVMFVGEQPGDQEDRQGAPFVGPAGAMLDKALEGAGIPRSDVYVTNAVKHFKWEPRGKRRIHKKPRISEIKACRPVARGRVARREAADSRLSRRDGGAVGHGAAIQVDAEPRESNRHAGSKRTRPTKSTTTGPARGPGRGHDSSVGGAAGP